MTKIRQHQINSELQNRDALSLIQSLELKELEILTLEELKGVSGGLLPGTSLFGHKVIGEC